MMSYERFASTYSVATDWRPSTSIRRRPGRAVLMTMLLFAIGGAVALAALAVAKGVEGPGRIIPESDGGSAFVQYADFTDDPVRLATIKIVNGCSGVCVSPAGFVMTAKHCKSPEKVRVRFPATGREVDAHRVYVSEEGEGPVVFHCEGDSFPFLPVAASKPEPGDKVRGVGYPGLDDTNYVAMTGTVVGGARDNSGVNYNQTDFQAMKGMSGGPLVNDRNEVIGLLTGGDGASTIWISHTATRQAYDAAVIAPPMPPNAPAGRPKLVAFTAAFCQPCKLAEDDVRGDVAGLATLVRTHFDWTIVKATITGWDRPDMARAFVVATGVEIPGAPTFWIEGTSHYLSGYPPKTGNRNLQTFLKRFIPEPTPAADAPPVAAQADVPKPVSAPVSVPDPESEIDWTGAKVVLLLARQDLGATGDVVARAALELDHSLLRRRFNELTGGRGSIEIVAERTRPTRFATVSAALQVDVDKFHVALLVKQQEIGALRGVGVKLAGRLLEGLTTTEVPVSIVSERVHPTHYQLVSDALIVPEPVSDAPASEEDVPWWYGLIAAVVGLFKRRFLKEQPNA